MDNKPPFQIGEKVRMWDEYKVSIKNTTYIVKQISPSKSQSSWLMSVKELDRAYQLYLWDSDWFIKIEES